MKILPPLQTLPCDSLMACHADNGVQRLIWGLKMSFIASCTTLQSLALISVKAITTCRFSLLATDTRNT